MTAALTYADVFGGIGGISLGFDRAGLVCTAQIEIDRNRRRILARQWPNVQRGENVVDVHGRDLGAPDVVAGGFPCKGTSTAAPHRLGLADPRSGLFWEFRRLLDEHLRVVDDTKPRWVVIENPPGLLSSNGGRDMGAVVRGLEDLGYGWAYRVVDSRFLGSAQRRERVLVVGHRGGDPRPAWQVLADTEGGGADPRLADPGRSTAGRPALAAVPDAGRDELLIFRQSRRPRSKTDFATWVPATYTNTLTCFDTGFTGRQKHIVIGGDGRPRFLTLTEWERLQGFPDDWTAGIPDSARFDALGDAMCVPMATWLGRRLVAVDRSLPYIPRRAA
jgi:DNA (cytosine-5)-methyltransferase 1